MGWEVQVHNCQFLDLLISTITRFLVLTTPRILAANGIDSMIHNNEGRDNNNLEAGRPSARVIRLLRVVDKCSATLSEQLQ